MFIIGRKKKRDMIGDSQYDTEYAHLAMSAALFGVIPHNLRAVEVKMEGQYLFMYFTYHEYLTSEEREELELAASEAECSFPVGYLSDFYFFRVDAPAKLPRHGGDLVYLRKEPTS